MSATKYLKVFTGQGGHLAAAIYEHNGQYIAVEKSSSMGFRTPEIAQQWIITVCKGEPMELGAGSMIPLNIREEIANVMQQIKA